MAFLDDILGSILGPVRDIIGDFVTDPDKKLEANVKIRELEDQVYARYHDEVMGQLEVNKAEAENSSLFVAGWRPAVGWVGAFGLAYEAILQPFLNWSCRIAGYAGTLPALDSTVLITVLGGMLGIGGLRTFEKVKGVATSSINQPAPLPPTSVTVDTDKGEVSVETSPQTVPAKKKKHFHIF